MTPVEPLAENRTRRVDPLQHFQYYEGGWDPSSKDYWARLQFYEGGWDPSSKDYWAVSGIYGLVVGAAWVVLGISILAFALCACLFCRKRWKARLDGDQPQYTPFQIRVPLAALLLAAVVIL
ncbi:unnamed protein product [Closterium sp. NIES-64]|nr:unnamed protein product [Closterium sp. NIES-64]